MSERKNINNLFQEKFENHEITPDEIVWEQIEFKLKEKKDKRRVIPFWWKFTGIAASLLIGFFIYYNTSKLSTATEDNLVNQEKETLKETSREKIENLDANKNSIAKSNDTNSKTKNGVVSITNKKETNTIDADVLNNVKPRTNSNKINQTIKFETKQTTNNVVATRENKAKSDESKISNENLKSSTNKKETTKETIAILFSKEIKRTTDKAFSENKNSTSLATESDNKSDKNSKAKNTIDQNINQQKNIIVETNSNIIEKNNPILNSKINIEETINKKIDSAKIAIVEPNALEELQNEKEKKTITEPKLNRWQVSSNIAPIYFSSTSNGSPLDSKLASNDKTYSINNTSYGLGVNYALNKKLKIRTGVSLVNLDYDTNGILYYQNPSVNGKLTNVNPNVPGSLLVIESLSNVTSFFGRPIQKSEGILNQKLGYIEMPLEISYKVLDKKFGIDFIGGMSTMVLNRNEIYLQSSEFNLKIGEANNLNNIHFSGNLGVGFKYGFMKNFEARIEPVFKYQINTFSNDAGNFKPYMFGVYSGINFSF
jgi:hypothetical protein